MLHRPPRLSLIATAAATSVALLLIAATAALADPRTETVYAGGQTYQFAQTTVVFNAAPGLLEHASPVYVIGFPVAAGTTGPITLPSGYQPQNNGLPSPIPYHDHVLVAVPGQPGYVAPLRVVQLRYTWAYAYSLPSSR